MIKSLKDLNRANQIIHDAKSGPSYQQVGRAVEKMFKTTKDYNKIVAAVMAEFNVSRKQAEELIEGYEASLG